jgi:hypothetical protein
MKKCLTFLFKILPILFILSAFAISYLVLEVFKLGVEIFAISAIVLVFLYFVDEWMIMLGLKHLKEVENEKIGTL